MMAKAPFERFMAKVKWSANGCLEWTASRHPDGYGQFGGATAYRFIYEYFFGPVPKGYELDHTCRNKWCVNPNHLDAVTHQVNVIRGKGPTAINAAKTHCINGHELSGSNLVRDKGRRCRICHYARNNKNWKIRFEKAKSTKNTV